MRDSKMDTCASSASVHGGRGVQKASPNILANIDSDNCIGCTKGDKPMPTDLKSTLSGDDVQYIKNLLAEGIARMLVEKVAKSSDLAVDNLEPERYTRTPLEKGGTL